MIFEMSGRNATGAPISAYMLRGNPRAIVSDATRIAASTTHLEGANVAYGDGHVKWKSIATIIADAGTSSTACTLSAIDETRGYCSRAWNPFRP